VEPGSGEALAQAVLHLRDPPALAQELGQRGREFVRAHFDRDQLVMTLEGRLLALTGARHEDRETQLPVREAGIRS
jgi:hypothetical protein